MDVNIKGTVITNEDKWIYDLFGIDTICPSDIVAQLEKANGEDVTFIINSGGGDVFAGNEINYLISQYKGKTVADIVGIAASIATVIACSADTVRMTAGAQYMVHNVSSRASGDYHAMDKASEILKTANRTISNTYRLKTGMSEKELLALMDKETWLDAVKAKEYGFVDEIIGDDGTLSAPKSLYNNSSFVYILSDEAKKKIRNSLKNPVAASKDAQSNSAFFMQEKIKIERLRGKINEI